MSPNTQDKLGEIAYNAYCSTRNWTSYRGEPLPHWTKVEEGIKKGWIEAATKVIEEHERPYLEQN